MHKNFINKGIVRIVNLWVQTAKSIFHQRGANCNGDPSIFEKYLIASCNHMYILRNLETLTYRFKSIVANALNRIVSLLVPLVKMKWFNRALSQNSSAHLAPPNLFYNNLNKNKGTFVYNAAQGFIVIVFFLISKAFNLQLPPSALSTFAYLAHLALHGRTGFFQNCLPSSAFPYYLVLERGSAQLGCVKKKIVFCLTGRISIILQK